MLSMGLMVIFYELRVILLLLNAQAMTVQITWFY